MIDLDDENGIIILLLTFPKPLGSMANPNIPSPLPHPNVEEVINPKAAVTE